MCHAGAQGRQLNHFFEFPDDDELNRVMEKGGNKDTIAVSGSSKKPSPLQVLLQIKHRVGDVQKHPYNVAEAHFR